MSRVSKKEMLIIMKDAGWDSLLTEKDSWQDIKDEYDVFLDEDDSTLYPNGRDYDAEDNN